MDNLNAKQPVVQSSICRRVDVVRRYVVSGSNEFSRRIGAGEIFMVKAIREHMLNLDRG